MTNPWLSESGGLTDRRRVPSQTGRGWEAEQRPCGVLTGEHQGASPCVWRELPPSHPTPRTLTLTVNTTFSETFLAGPWALGGGTSLECREPQTRRAQNHRPHGREPRSVRGGPAVRPRPRQRRPRPLCSVFSVVQENNNPHKDPFISAPRCSPTLHPPTARGQCPHAAGGANQGSTANLSGRKQLGLVSSRTGWLWVWPGGLPHTWCGLPQTAGLGPAGSRGQDRLGESETLTTFFCDQAGCPGASWD